MITDPGALLHLHEAVTIEVEMTMEETNLVVIVSDLAADHVRHIITVGITDREVQVLERSKLLKMRPSVFPDAMLEIYQTFTSFSWRSWTASSYHGLRLRCEDKASRPRFCSLTHVYHCKP